MDSSSSILEDACYLCKAQELHLFFELLLAPSNHKMMGELLGAIEGPASGLV